MTEGPYKLPKGWRWVKLEDVCKYDRRTIDPRRFPEQYFCLYSIPAYDKGRQPELLKGSEIGSAKLSIDPDDICLFSKLNPRIPRSWILKKDTINSKFTLIASTEFMPLRVQREILDLEYLGFYLLSNVLLVQVCAGATGATGSRKRLKPENVLNALIPLPPIEEQRQIIAWVNEMLTRVREAKRLRQEAQQEAERLWQSVLADTFPKPGTELPNGWQWLRLDECITTIESGKRPKGGVRKLKIEKGIFSIGGEHLTWDGGFDFSRPRLIPEEYYYSIKKGKIKPHDILIVKDGATTGKTAYVSENFPFQDACVNEHVFIIRAKKDLILPKYLFLFLLSSFGKKQILSTFHGAAQGGINSQFVKRVFIPVTSLANQKNIVSYLESTKEKIIALKNSQEEVDFEINMLEKIILEKAFRGEL